MVWTPESFYRIRIKKKEKKNRKYLIQCGHISQFGLGEKAQSWLGVWKIFHYVEHISCKTSGAFTGTKMLSRFPWLT